MWYYPYSYSNVGMFFIHQMRLQIFSCAYFLIPWNLFNNKRIWYELLYSFNYFYIKYLLSFKDSNLKYIIIERFEINFIWNIKCHISLFGLIFIFKSYFNISFNKSTLIDRISSLINFYWSCYSFSLCYKGYIYNTFNNSKYSYISWNISKLYSI